MRGSKSSSSSSKTKNGGLETEKLEKLKEPHLSGAYIRSLVKQLTSSRTKDSPNSKELENSEGEPNMCDGFSDHKQEKSHQNQPPHKKQVRRRLHTSRPYQERLLNMAEARREIVTALKFHRASMKQASEKQQQQVQQTGPEPEFQPELEPHQTSLEQQEAKLKSRRNPRIYATSNNFPTNYVENSNFSYSPGFYSPYPWSASPMAPPPLIQENLNFALPSQTLGLNLNLNLQDFNYFEATTTPFHNPSSIYSSSSPSTSSSPLSATTDEYPCMGVPPPPVAAEVAEFEDSGLHHAMDDQEMAEIRSIGEQYQMELDDTLNLVNSAWWFKFLKSMEIENEKGGEEFVSSPFDEVMEFPAWLNANEMTDSCSEDYFPDPALPCMEIEEIEGMDGDWLA